MANMKFYCDAERCIECNACVTACKNENEVPWGVNRRRVVTIKDGEPGERSLSVACMHCADAPCAAVGFRDELRGIRDSYDRFSDSARWCPVRSAEFRLPRPEP